MDRRTDSLFLFLMDLAWKCRFSLPMLLACSMAAIGQACVFQINISTHVVRGEQADSETSGEESGSESLSV